MWKWFKKKLIEAGLAPVNDEYIEYCEQQRGIWGEPVQSLLNSMDGDDWQYTVQHGTYLIAVNEKHDISFLTNWKYKLCCEKWMTEEEAKVVGQKVDRKYKDQLEKESQQRKQEFFNLKEM